MNRALIRSINIISYSRCSQLFIVPHLRFFSDCNKTNEHEEKEKKYSFSERTRDGLREFSFDSTKQKFISKNEEDNSIKGKLLRRLQEIPKAFLPKGYPKTVNGEYLPYCIWTSLSWVFSSAGGVLSMQSLLSAVGVGQGSTTLAAGLNWVIKDGLGQFGGVLFATLVSNHLDSASRSWRFLAAFALELSTWLEVLTPLFPKFFIPLAAIANTGKNISWLAGSATRAGIRYGFINAANMSDITAKEGSQSTMSTVIGTCIGIALSPYVCIHRGYVLATSFTLSLLSLYCLHKALKHVVLPTINKERGYYIMNSFLSTQLIPSTEDIATMDSIYIPYMKNPEIPVIMGESFQKVVEHIHTTNDYETFISIFEKEQYILNSFTSKPSKMSICISLSEDATSNDQLFGYLHGYLFRKELLNNSLNNYSQVYINQLLMKTYKLSKDLYPKYISELTEKNWNTSNIFIEEKNKRYTLHLKNKND
ncbi:hypothetical protein WA158_008162 [Blastocystis sp. Blastoise]